MTPPYRVFIGWDAAEMTAWNVAQMSLKSHASVSVDVKRIALRELQAVGLYTRPTSQRKNGLWDDISDAPMSTGHAIARFLVPALCDYDGWALFTDGDVLFRRDVAELFALADPQYAIQVVQHLYAPKQTVKMTGQRQTVYARKNWSSVILWHCGHPANQAVTPHLVNTVPGRDLHRFCWLGDDEIGSLPMEWNFLIGHYTIDPAIVHFTEGLPDMPGYERVAFADEWLETAKGCGYKVDAPAAVTEVL